MGGCSRTEAVFVILTASSYVTAVNIMRPVEALDRASARIWRRTLQPAVEALGEAITGVQHFIGGPMQAEDPLAMVELRWPGNTSTSSSLVSGLLQRLPSSGGDRKYLVKAFPNAGKLYCSRVSDILPLVQKHHQATGEV